MLGINDTLIERKQPFRAEDVRNLFQGSMETQMTLLLCITDMLKAKDGDFFVTDWLRNRNTLEFLDIWEQVYNPVFNYGEFAIIKSKAGLNNFKISVKEFVERTQPDSHSTDAGVTGSRKPQVIEITIELGLRINE